MRERNGTHGGFSGAIEGGRAERQLRVSRDSSIVGNSECGVG